MDTINKILEWMRRDQMDALLVACPYNVRYLTGFSGDVAYLYISEKRRVLLTDSRYVIWARNQSKDFEIVEVSNQFTYEQALFAYAREEQVKSIGFENTKMLYSDVIKFQNALSFAQMLPVDERLDQMRQIKRPDELAKIKEAERIGDDAFSYILTKIKKGMTEQEVALELEIYMKKQGAERLSFETIAASGPNSAMPHAVPGKRALMEGDFLTLDFGCVYEGYCSDMTRTVVIGKASARQKEIYNVALSAQLNALSAIKAGVTGQLVDSVARETIRSAGYGTYFGHGLGHSVGLYIHESPRLAPKDQTALRENMTETVEPGIYIPDFGGVRIEDLIVVKQDGYENFTKSPKELIEL